MTHEHKCLLIACPIVLLYLLAGFLTYGYTKVRRNMEAEQAVAAGMFWPLYWVARLVVSGADAAEGVFKAAPPPKVER